MSDKRTLTERLRDALSRDDDGRDLYVGIDSEAGVLAADGRWAVATLDAALVEHLVPLSTVVTEHEWYAVFLREVWATGTTGDGREFEISASGPTLILQIGPFDATREVYSIRLQDLALAWLRAVGAGS